MTTDELRDLAADQAEMTVLFVLSFFFSMLVVLLVILGAPAECKWVRLVAMLCPPPLAILAAKFWRDGHRAHLRYIEQVLRPPLRNW